MDRYHSLTTSALALRSDNKPGALPAYLRNSPPPGRQLIDRVSSGCVLDKPLWQLRRQKRGCGGFYHQTSGMAAVYLGLLRDPHTRKDFLRLTRVSPDSFRSDEDCARALAVGWMIGNLAKICDAEFDERLDQFCHERQKAQRLHELGKDYEEDARRHVWKALLHLEAARSTIARYAACYAGWSLERDFGGLRAPRLVAKLVTDAVGVRPKVTEAQVRYLCRWIKRRPERSLVA